MDIIQSTLSSKSMNKIEPIEALSR